MKFFAAPGSIAALVLGLFLLEILTGGSALARAGALPLHSLRGLTSADALPVELGEIVYQKNSGRPLHLYIIANSHRSSGTGANGNNTVLSQIQTYRIGEWLIRQHQVELLLPEGFFGQAKAKVRTAAERLDDLGLENILADTSVFMNADLLLRRDYGVALHQVEDQELYRSVREYLVAGWLGGASLHAPFGPEFAYLQERRSAAILQRIPFLINNEYRLGHISRPRAMLTIGMAHLDEILKFLEAGRIEIPAVETGGGNLPAYTEELAHFEKEVGVTVIVPRALLDERALQAVAGLGTVTAAIP